MKKAMLLGVALAGVLLGAGRSSAEGIENKVALLLDGGLITYGNADVVELADTFGDNGAASSGFMGRVSVLYGISPFLQLGLETEYLNVYTQAKSTLDLVEEVGGLPVVTGTADLKVDYWLPTVNVNATLRGVVPLSPAFSLAPAVSLGLAMQEFRAQSQFAQDPAQETVKNYHGINAKVVLGGEFRLTGTVCAGAEVGYRFLAVLDTPNRSSFTGRTYDDLGGLVLTGGIRLYL